MGVNVKEMHQLAASTIEALVTLGNHFIIDEDGRVLYNTEPNDPVMFKVKGVGKPLPLINYSVNPPVKGIMLNPFVETVGDDSPDRLWIYHVTNGIHATVFARIVEFIFEQVVKAAKGENVEDPALIHVLSGIIGNADLKTEGEFAKLVKNIPEFEDGFDEKMVRECETITENPRPKDFVSIARNKNEKKAWLSLFLSDDEGKFRKSFGNKIRVKTWKLVEAILQEIYGLDDLTGRLYEEVSTSKKCPTFSAYLKVLVKSWNRFIPYLEYIYTKEGAEDIVNKLIFLESVQDKLEDIAKCAAWSRPATAAATSTNGLQIEDDSERADDNQPIDHEERGGDRPVNNSYQPRRPVQNPNGRKSAIDLLERDDYDNNNRRQFSRSYHMERNSRGYDYYSPRYTGRRFVDLGRYDEHRDYGRPGIRDFDHRSNQRFSHTSALDILDRDAELARERSMRSRLVFEEDNRPRGRRII